MLKTVVLLQMFVETWIESLKEHLLEIERILNIINAFSDTFDQ